MVETSPHRVDDLAIRAMRRVSYDFVSAAEVKEITRAHLAAEFGDAFDVAADVGTHPYIVISVLDNLLDEGRLPAHPSWW